MLIFLCASNSFEYTKTVDAFNFNFNGDVNNPGAKVSPLKPANGADNFICKIVGLTWELPLSLSSTGRTPVLSEQPRLE